MDDVPAALPKANPPPSARRGSRLAKAVGLLVFVALVASGIVSCTVEGKADSATVPSVRLAEPPGRGVEAMPGSLGTASFGVVPSLGDCGSVLDDHFHWTPGECAASEDLIVVELVKAGVLMWPDPYTSSDIRRIAQRGCPESTQYFTSHEDKVLPRMGHEGQIKGRVIVACWAAR